MATLVVTDAGDGTGGTATVSGGAGGETHTLYRSEWSGAMGTYAWTSSGSRVGDGTIALSSPTIPLGYYVWQLISVNGGVTTVSSLYNQNLSTNTEAVHYRILVGVKTRLGNLSLSGLTASNIMLMWSPMQVASVNNPPRILISPIGAESSPGRVTNQDDVGFPVLVGFVDAGNLESQKNLARDLKWRDQIARALRYQRLPGVSEVFQVVWIPDAVVNTLWLEQNKIVSFMLFRFLVRQTRGLT